MLPNITMKKTTIKQALGNSVAAILRVDKPFLQQMNYERIYHGLILQPNLIADVKNEELLCATLACIG